MRNVELLLAVAMTSIHVLFWGAVQAEGFDCSKIKPFSPNGAQRVELAVSRYYWTKEGHSDWEDLCKGSLKIASYDIRGREEEAYYCLKPAATEILLCKTILNGDAAEIAVVPATSIQNSKHGDIRTYRFHSYVYKVSNPDYFYDIYSRSSSANLSLQNITVEGALKTGPKNPDDGFWIRAEFRR